MAERYSEGDDRRYDILLVEEKPADIAPFIDSFEATDATEDVHVVSDGDEALAFIHRRGDHEDVSRPDLVLLDLHLPGTSGERVLKELNEQPELRSIPVLVFTSSDAAEDVARSYRLNANAYLEKPTEPEKFVTLAQAIEDFWLKQAHLPPK